MALKINIVCTDTGWIYSKFIDMFRKYSKHEILLNSKEKCDVTHCIPYYELGNKPSWPCTAWFSHQETKGPLKSRFVTAAREVDIPISHSKKYADMLRNEYGVDKVVQIIPGVDLDVFIQRSVIRPKSTKLIVGYIGRQYSSSNRKNPELLDKISKLPFVDFRVTGGNVVDKNIPKFYAGLDLVISPATTEGGPMSIQEALAVGTPVMCFEDVGVAQEFGVGVIKVDKGDIENTFTDRLKTIWQTNSYEEFRKTSVMNQMRKQVIDQTWGRFVRRHDNVWESLV